MPRVNRGRRRRRGLLSVLLLVVALAAAFMFLRSPYFAVVEVEVRGLQTLTAEEIVAWSGIESSVLIWRIEPAAVARRVEQHPAVAGAAVERLWPNRLRITIRERTPVAVMRYHGLWLLVDGQGIGYRLQQERPAGLPELRGGTVDGHELGRPLGGHLPDAARLAAYVRQYGLEWVEAVEAAPDELLLWLEGGVPVYFGSVEDQPDRKLAVVNTLWTSWRADATHVRYLDVRNPEHPAVGTDTE